MAKEYSEANLIDHLSEREEFYTELSKSAEPSERKTGMLSLMKVKKYISEIKDKANMAREAKKAEQSQQQMGDIPNRVDGGNIPGYYDGLGRRPFALRRAEQYRPDNTQGEALYNVGSNIYANPNSPYDQSYFDKHNKGLSGPYVADPNQITTANGTNYDPFSGDPYRPTNFLPGQDQIGADLERLSATDPEGMVPYNDSVQGKKAVGVMSEEPRKSNEVTGATAAPGSFDWGKLGQTAANIAPMIYSMSQKPESVPEQKNLQQPRVDMMRQDHINRVLTPEKRDLREFWRQLTKGRNRSMEAASQGPSAQANRLMQDKAQSTYGEAAINAAIAENAGQPTNIQKAQAIAPIQAQVYAQGMDEKNAREKAAQEALGAKTALTDVTAQQLAAGSKLADTRTIDKNVASQNALQMEILKRNYPEAYRAVMGDNLA